MNFDISSSRSPNQGSERPARFATEATHQAHVSGSGVQSGSGRAYEDKFVVRFPEGMRDRLADEAKDRHRSMNSEIVYRMESTLELESEVNRLKKVVDVLIAMLGPTAAGLALIGKEA